MTAERSHCKIFATGEVIENCKPDFIRFAAVTTAAAEKICRFYPSANDRP